MDPGDLLRSLESNLGFPLALTAPGNQRVYRSRAWPPPDAMGDALVASHQIKTGSGQPVLTVSVLRDVKTLQSKLLHTRYQVIGIAITLAALAAVTAYNARQPAVLQRKAPQGSDRHPGSRVTP